MLANELSFILDRRDGNGFWVPFKVYAVWGQFCCPVDDSCIWESKEIQVDVLVRELLLTTDCPSFPWDENYYFSVSLQFRDQDRRGEDWPRVSTEMSETRGEVCPSSGGGAGRSQVGDDESPEVHLEEILRSWPLADQSDQPQVQEQHWKLWRLLGHLHHQLLGHINHRNQWSRRNQLEQLQ